MQTRKYARTMNEAFPFQKKVKAVAQAVKRALQYTHCN
jgi:hypothetical protein